MCLNRKVLLALGAVAASVLIFRPSALGAALPLVVLAACPLSMVFMMRSMRGAAGSATPNRPQNEDKDRSLDTEVARLRDEVGRLRVEAALRDASVGRPPRDSDHEDAPPNHSL